MQRFVEIYLPTPRIYRRRHFSLELGLEPSHLNEPHFILARPTYVVLRRLHVALPCLFSGRGARRMISAQPLQG